MTENEMLNQFVHSDAFNAMFVQRYQGWSEQTKVDFRNLLSAAHDARYDWYVTDNLDLRVGRKEGQLRGRVLAVIYIHAAGPKFLWGAPVRQWAQIDNALIGRFVNFRPALMLDFPKVKPHDLDGHEGVGNFPLHYAPQ